MVVATRWRHEGSCGARVRLGRGLCVRGPVGSKVGSVFGRNDVCRLCLWFGSGLHIALQMHLKFPRVLLKVVYHFALSGPPYNDDAWADWTAITINFILAVGFILAADRSIGHSLDNFGRWAAMLVAQGHQRTVPRHVRC